MHPKGHPKPVTKVPTTKVTSIRCASQQQSNGIYPRRLPYKEAQRVRPMKWTMLTWACAQVANKTHHKLSKTAKMDSLFLAEAREMFFDFLIIKRTSVRKIAALIQWQTAWVWWPHKSIAMKSCRAHLWTFVIAYCPNHMIFRGKHVSLLLCHDYEKNYILHESLVFFWG